MTIILAFLGSVVSILILLNRLAEAGIDLGGLNPYLWHRRRKWKKKYQGDPVFKIENPMDATAILMVTATKADGDMTKEDKSLLLNLFEHEFKLPKKDAAGLLISSAHLVGKGTEIRSNVKKFLAPSKAAFTEAQAESALALIAKAAGDTETIHPNAQELLKQVRQELEPKPSSQQAWQ